ncbi:hypothetical protein BH11BAC4_BH11BAC4_26910 [soil metagenome]
MESNLKSSKTEFLYRPIDVFHDNVTKSKIYRHLNDINDVISEEDIRNIKVSIPGSEIIPFGNKDKSRNSLTTWDVLDA